MHLTRYSIINYSQKHPLFTAWLVNSILFTAVGLWGFPVYHSGDDSNMMHILGGGYGVAPSACLPYMHGMHYFFNVPLSWLFQHYPHTNWFSLLMWLAHYIACICLYYVLLRRKNFVVGTLSFLAAFLVFECWLLLYLHISSTSIVCALAGLVLIWYHVRQSAGYRSLLVAILAIVAGAFFRVHTLVPVAAVVVPFFMLLPGLKKMVRAATVVAIAFLLIAFFFTLQNFYYSKHCPGWQQDEEYRQAKYSYINYYRDTTVAALAPYKLEVSLAEDLVLFDTALPDKKTLTFIAQTAKAGMPLRDFFSTKTWYWHFINNRLFLFALIVSCLVFSFGKKEKLAIGAAILIAASCIIYLLQFRKLPEFLIPGMLFAMVFFMALTGNYKSASGVVRNSVTWLLIAGLFAWGGLRMYKMSRHNAASFQQFKQMHLEMSSHPDKLFINTGDGDLFSYFYVFATPAAYPFNNILFIDHPVTARAPYLLSKFGIQDIRTAPLLDNVYFRGSRTYSLPAYYEKILQRPVDYSDSIPGFRNSEIRKLLVR